MDENTARILSIFTETYFSYNGIKTDFTVKQELFEEDIYYICSLPLPKFINFLQRIGLVPSNAECPSCGIMLHSVTIKNGTNPIFWCGKAICGRKKVALLKDTIFAHFKIDIRLLFKILYSFSCRLLPSDVYETKKITDKPVISLYSFFRSALFRFCQINSHKLGGQDIILHCDETALKTRKHGVGKKSQSNTVWVIGAIDIVTRKCALEFLPSR